MLESHFHCRIGYGKTKCPCSSVTVIEQEGLAAKGGLAARLLCIGQVVVS